MSSLSGLLTPPDLLDATAELFGQDHISTCYLISVLYVALGQSLASTILFSQKFTLEVTSLLISRTITQVDVHS